MDGDEISHERNTVAVVVVDDEAAIVEFVCEALADAGFVATGCTIPEEAIALVQRVQPHLVILDVAMPRLDGFELLRQLRADAETAALPVLLMTASSPQAVQRLPDYRQLDAELLLKPFQLDALLEAVERMLGP